MCHAQLAKIIRADRADPRAGSKPHHPQWLRAGKRDRGEATFGRGLQLESLRVDVTGHLKGRNRPVGQVRFEVVEPRWSTSPVDSPQRPEEGRETISRPASY